MTLADQWTRSLNNARDTEAACSNGLAPAFAELIARRRRQLESMPAPRSEDELTSHRTAVAVFTSIATGVMGAGSMARPFSAAVQKEILDAARVFSEGHFAGTAEVAMAHVQLLTTINGITLPHHLHAISATRAGS